MRGSSPERLYGSVGIVKVRIYIVSCHHFDSRVSEEIAPQSRLGSTEESSKDSSVTVE
jgi:hypothetical protein